MLNERLQHLLEEQHAAYEVLAHHPTFTAHGTAAISHVPGRQFAKVVVVQARPEHPIMVVIPADCQLDLENVSDATGEGRLSLVPEAEFARLFPDCEIGAMPPLGNLYGMPVVVASCLAHRDEVFFNAGTHRTTVGMYFADLKRIVHPIVADVCRRH